MLLSALLCGSIALSSASPLGALVENQVTFELRDAEPGFQVPSGFNIDLKSMRLVQFADKEEPVWIPELDKITAKAAGKRFFDITDNPDSAFTPARVSFKPYGSPNATELVKPVLKTLSSDGPRSNLEKFTSFRTRYYRSEVSQVGYEEIKC
ncbi:Leucine aminopeptidase 1 [Ceratobasidium sp. UAMH 11750]|nr:Leucine aminopeptidase 1 [Ceratobasidium sp. UAMH 11750]